MNNNYFYFFFIFFLISSNFSAFASNVAFIDLDLVLQKTDYGKKVYQRIENVKTNNNEKILDEQKKLKLIEESILSKKNIISNIEFDSLISEYNQKLNNFNLLKKNINEEYYLLQQNEIKEFFTKINPLIERYLNDHSFDILLNSQNVIIGKENLDITNEIIMIVNQKIK